MTDIGIGDLPDLPELDATAWAELLFDLDDAIASYIDDVLEGDY